MLAKRGVPAFAAGEDGTSPLHIAARIGDERIVTLLLETRRANLNARDYSGATPMHWAAANGHPKVVIDLLERGAQPDATDLSDATPLHDAAWAGHAEVADALLKAGAQVDAVDAHGRTALHAAALLSQPDLVAVLLSAGAAEIPDDQQQYPLDFAHQASKWVQAVSKVMGSKYGEALVSRAQRVQELLERNGGKADTMPVGSCGY